ncbi:MAG: hypothetical protein V3V08_04665 [Nannocystaceae bacterium]
MPSLRLLATESLDPSGILPQWICPDVARLGWKTWTLPTFEAIQLLGHAAYRAMLVQVVSQLRPHVLLVLPPYDYLDLDSCAQIRNLGTRIVGLVIDDTESAMATTASDADSMGAYFDLWLTSSAAGPCARSGAKPLRWVMAPEALEIDDPRAPTHEAVMVGRHTPRRQSLAQALADSGVDLACFGAGWQNGPLTRRSRIGLFRRATTVIVLMEDRNATPIQLLEAGLLGKKLLIEDPDALARYFPEGEPRPPGFRDVQECVALFARGGSEVWRGVPTWKTLWPELVASLDLGTVPDRQQSAALDQLLASLAHLSELRGNLPGSVACFEAWMRGCPGDAGPRCGLARLAHRVGNWELTLARVREAQQRCCERRPTPVARVSLSRAAPSFGAGLGETGAVDPMLELHVLAIHALCALDRWEEAQAEVQTVPEIQRAAVRDAMLLRTDEGGVREVLEMFRRATLAT